MHRIFKVVDSLIRIIRFQKILNYNDQIDMSCA